MYPLSPNRPEGNLLNRLPIPQPEKGSFLIYPALLYPGLSPGVCRWIFKELGCQALISTSTPDGRSSFDRASTVLDEEV
jgi:hypothetical protein